MTPTIWFSEHSLRLRVDVRPDGSFPIQRSAVRGMSVERHLGDGCTEHRFADGDALLGTGCAGPTASAADVLREVQGRPVFEMTAQHRAMLTAIAAETGAELVLGVAEQHVAAGDPDHVRSTHRFVATLLLTLTGDDGTRHTQSVRWNPTDGPRTLALAARQTGSQMRDRLGLPLAEDGQPWWGNPLPELLAQVTGAGGDDVGLHRVPDELVEERPGEARQQDEVGVRG